MEARMGMGTTAWGGAEARERASREKEELRRAFDELAAVFDDAACGTRARSLYPAVLHEVGDAYRAYAAEEARAGRLRRGMPERSFRVLDAGCGTGALAGLIADSLPACRLRGVDLSSGMLRRARRQVGDAAVFEQADVERLPFGDGTFDCAVCNDTFHCFPDPRRAAFELWRVLRAGGTLVIGEGWRREPVRTVANLVSAARRDGARMCSEAELRAALSGWFGYVEWRQVSSGACVVRAYK